MYSPLLLSFFILIICLSEASIAASTTTKTSQHDDVKLTEQNKILSQQRLLFQEAETAIEKKQFDLYRQKVKQIRNLGDYPLLSYLRFEFLQTQFSRLKNNNIEVFIKNNQDTPYAARLRREWLNYLAKYKRWNEYLEFYPQNAIETIFHTQEINKRISKASTRRACHYLNALVATNQESQALSLVEKLWLSERSQPKACDKVFKLWQNKGLLTSELRWQRILLAINKNKRSLAKYIAKPFKGKDKVLISTWMSLYNRPQKLFKSKILAIKHPHQEQLLNRIIKRLSYKNTEFAEKILDDKKLLARLPESTQNELYYHTGLILAKRHEDKAFDILNKINDKNSDNNIREWRIRAAIRNQNWSQIHSSIERLTNDEKETNRWQYWYAKSLIMIDTTKQEAAKNKNIAESIFKKLAKKRSFYGFLAADYLNVDYDFGHKTTVIDKKALNKFSQNSTIKRAFEFYSIRKLLEARREWYFLTSNLSNDDELEMAAKVAQSWGWHDRAILTIAQTKRRDDLHLRFPISYHQLVDKYANKHSVDQTYILAFIRRESAFAKQARSPVGAIGLMQVMPKTGKSVAKKHKIKFKGKYQLYEPEYNIKIGTKYLQAMLKRYQDQIILASSAYNAGPHRVKKWLPKDKSISAVNWIETIPFNETRNYVSAILMYRAIYQYRLAKPITRISDALNLFNEQQALLFSDKQTNLTEQTIPDINSIKLTKNI